MVQDDYWAKFCARAQKAADEENHSYAEASWMVALQEAEEFGQDDERLITTLEGLRKAYVNQGKFRQAEKPNRQLLDIHRRKHGESHLLTGMAAHNLAKIYHMQQKYGQAEPLYKQGMSIKTKLLGATDPDVMGLVEGYADLLMKTHREEEARNLIKCLQGATGEGQSNGSIEQTQPTTATKTTASTTERTAPAPAAPTVAAVVPAKVVAPAATAVKAKEPVKETWEDLEKKAEIAYAAGKLEEAVSIWNQAIALAERIPSNDKCLALSLDRVGEILCRLEKFGQAEMAWWRSLQIKLRVLGTSHPAVAFTGNHLAGLHYLMGRYSEAESYSRKCLAIYQTCYGLEHPNVAVCMHNLASLYHVQGRYDEAEEQYKAAVNVRTKVLGVNHPDTISVTKSYADLLKTLGRDAEAKSLNSAANGLITGSWKAIVIADDQSLADPTDVCSFCGANINGVDKCNACGTLRS